jgi:PAS domain S-box-containing protein
MVVPPSNGDVWTLEHAALAAADLGAWDWQIATNKVSWSQGVYRLFGVEPGMFAGTVEAYTELIHPDDRELMSTAIGAALAGPSDDWMAEHRVAGLEPERWLSCRGRVFRDDQGRPLRMAGVVQDATPRHRAERQHRELSKLMQAALDASAFAVTVLEPSGKIVFCNTRAARLLGLSRSAAEGRSFDAPQFKHTAVDGGPWPDDAQPFRRVMATGQPVRDVEHAIELAGGDRRILRINGAPIKDEAGAVSLVVCSFEDITERRVTEDALRQSQKMDAIGRLAGGVAHDFNNLLTIILSIATIIRRNKRLPSELQHDLEVITEAAERGAALTRQLLAFGRRDPNRPVVFDARVGIADSVRLIERAVGTVGVLLELSAEPCFVRMDERQLQQVLLNLALNARDAMPAGGQIRIGAARVELDGTSVPGLPAGPYVRMHVSDEGVGMNDSTRRKALEPFFTTKPPHEGTGLGLSTCHGIILQVGGELSIESSLGRGTTITLHVPLVDPPTEQVEPPIANREVAAGRGRVLVVEDEPAVRAIAVRALEQAGYDVLAAATGDEALAVAQEAGPAPDLVVCDVLLPGLSGFEVVKALRAARPGLPVLYVSGFTAEIDRVGADAFLAKPYRPEALIAFVRELLAPRA